MWPAVDCISAALAARHPFVVRYEGLTMDSGTETVFVARHNRVYRIYQDRAGPFTSNAVRAMPYASHPAA